MSGKKSNNKTVSSVLCGQSSVSKFQVRIPLLALHLPLGSHQGQRFWLTPSRSTPCSDPGTIIRPGLRVHWKLIPVFEAPEAAGGFLSTGAPRAAAWSRGTSSTWVLWWLSDVNNNFRRQPFPARINVCRVNTFVVPLALVLVSCLHHWRLYIVSSFFFLCNVLFFPSFSWFAPTELDLLWMDAQLS
jgi:hypothetical protein